MHYLNSLAIVVKLAVFSLPLLANASSYGGDEPANNDEQTLPSPKELIDRLGEQLSTIDSLYCEYQIDFISKQPADTKSSKHRFARSGKKWLHAWQKADEPDTEGRVLYDGDTFFEYRLQLLPEGERMHGRVQMEASHEYPTMHPDAFLGSDVSVLRRSVVNVLRLADVELAREKTEDGTNCFRLVARDVGTNEPQSTDPARTKPRFTVEVVLDPTHDWLPREVLITDDVTTVTWPGHKKHFKVLDYRRVVDDRTNKARWFPFSVLMEQGISSAPDIKFTVDKLRINSELPNSLFELEIPDGTDVYDMRILNPGSRVPKKGQR